MNREPSNLIYGANDRPGPSVLFTLGLQHLFISSVGLVFPVILAVEAGVGPEQTGHLIQATLIAVGLATVLQGLRKAPVGSGYLCPGVGSPVYLPGSLLAIQTGGLSLMFGMLFFAGFVEALFSRILPRLRALLPTEVTGLMVATIGLWLIQTSISRLVGVSGEDTVAEVPEVLVGGIALAAMCAFSVWGKGFWRLYCVLIGIAAGCLAAWALGVMNVADLAPLASAPLVSAPGFAALDWSFDLALALPFAIAGLISALKATGDLTVCQKIDAPNWKRPEMGSISRGILADAVGTMAAGVFGGAGQSTSTSNVGCAIATGAASRWICFTAGGLAIVLAFFPKVAALVSLLPTPVMGAALTFAAGFMIVAGFQVICSRMLDTRKMLVVGLSLTLGLSVDLAPELYAQAPAWITAAFDSSLSVTLVAAIFLNLLFRIGVARRRSFTFAPGADASAAIVDFMDKSGAAWGARPEAIERGTSIVAEFAETAAAEGLARRDVKLEAAFDEFNLNFDLRYEGKPIAIPPSRPAPDEVLGRGGVARLSGYLIAQLADDVRMETRDGNCRLRIRIEH